jgi:hypothetical protein
MMAVLIVSAFLFAAYMAALIALFGVPESISDSFYLLNGKKKNAGCAFTVWCYAVGASVMAMMFELSSGAWYQFLGLFAGAGLGFVGTAPMFKSHEKLIHSVSASTCAVASLLWMTVAGYWFFPSALILAAAIIAGRFGKALFWTETALFVSMYITLFFCFHYDRCN